MPRGNGGIIGPANIPTTASAKGVWSLIEQMIAQRQGIWPLSGTDPFFYYTTLLLPGNGTNGAQNNTFLDGSANNFTITRNGNTTQGTFSPFSQTGWGNYFDGSGDYLTTPNVTALNLYNVTNTVECWVYPLSFSTAFQLYGTDFDGTYYTLFEILSTSGYPRYISRNGTQITGSSGVTLNQWNHVAFGRSGSTQSIWVNGIRVASGTITSEDGWGTAVISIGRFNAESRANGYLSNLRVVKGTDVYGISNTTITVPTAPLTAIANTSLLTCQSNRFIDNSSNNFTITRNGDTRVVAFSPFNPTENWSAAAIGGSGYFDGAGDYLVMATASAAINPSTSTTPFTIECWVYTTGTTSTTLYSALASENYGFVLGFGGALGAYDSNQTPWFGNFSGSWNGIRSTTSIPLMAWTHIACVFTGSTSYIYQNGVMTASGGPSTWAVTGSSKVRIGCRPDGPNPFTGYISNARVVIGSNLYPNGTTFTPPTAPLTAITNTSLLLNFTNAGIYDATAKNVLETVGDAKISTAQSKWGGSSISFDGTGDYLINASINSPLYQFNSGDFTVEMWIYPTTVSVVQYIIDFRDPASQTSAGIQWFLSSSAKCGIYVGTTAIIAASTTSITANTWTHVALVKNGTGSGNYKIYINGTADATTGTNTTALTQGFLSVGTSGNQRNTASTDKFNGYIQDLRVTTGYARYTTNFTAPTAAFPTL